MVDHELTSVLDQHREALMAIEGVIGVGLSETDTGPTIQLFVSPSVNQELVHRRAVALVADVPLSLVSMSTPTASNDT